MVVGVAGTEDGAAGTEDGAAAQAGVEVSVPAEVATLEAAAPQGGGEHEPLVAFLQTSLDGPGR